MRYCNLFTQWWLDNHELFNNSDVIFNIVNNFTAFYRKEVKFLDAKDTFRFLDIAQTIVSCTDYRLLKLSLKI